MALHDPDLQKAHAANQRAIALANVSETVIRNFEAMTVGERRFAHEVAIQHAIQHDILARGPNRDADYHRSIAKDQRDTAAALKAIGL